MALIFCSILYLSIVNFFPWCYLEGKIYHTHNSNISDFQQQISLHSQDIAICKHETDTVKLQFTKYGWNVNTHPTISAHQSMRLEVNKCKILTQTAWESNSKPVMREASTRSYAIIPTLLLI